MSKIILRDYQKQIIDEFFLKEKTFDNVLSMANMGAGKSIIIAELIQRLSSKNKIITVFINIEKILIQLKDLFTDLGINFNIISKNEKRIVESNNIWLIMEQSFHANRRELLEHKFDTVDYLIKDEYHIGADKKRINDIIDFLNPKKIFGFSGTPFDEQGFLLKDFTLANIILNGNATELTRLKHLSPLSYIVSKHSENLNFNNVKVSSNDYSTKELEELLNNSQHTKFVLKAMNEINAKKKKTLVYTNSIKHAEVINRELENNGYKTKCIHSKVKTELSDYYISEFKKEESEIDCLVSVSQLTTGFDAPIAELCVLLRPTKIVRLYLQMIYRVARIFEGKTQGVILDLAQCVREHGFGDDFRPLLENKKENKQSMKLHKEVQKENRTTCLLQNLEKIDSLLKIDIDSFNISLREIKRNFFLIKNKKMDELFKEYIRVIDLEDIILIANEINSRTHGTSLEKNNLNSLLNTFKALMISEEDVYHFKSSLTKLVRNKTFTIDDIQTIKYISK